MASIEDVLGLQLRGRDEGCIGGDDVFADEVSVTVRK